MAKMYLMHGLSGAGKTEFAKRFARENNLRYLSIEDFYAAFFGSELIHQNEEEVWAAFEIAIRVAEKEQVDIIVDTNSPRRADRDWFFEKFPTYSINLIIIDTPVELCLKNNRERERKIPEEEMQKMITELEPVTEDELGRYESVVVYKNTDNHLDAGTRLA
jgi:predicted kinase